MPISADVLDHIMSEYDAQIPTNTLFTKACARLIEEILTASNVKYHSVTPRVKSRESLRLKALSSTGYQSLSDATDICGVRIITYFADEVDKVAKIIEEEFGIDREHSIDKRNALDPDRFGYLSLHYVAKMSPNRLQLRENRGFTKCQVEIQIRSILQHSWAEIQHNLGYKTAQSVPRELQRRFSRLAGLLEIADDEFTAIREDFEKYEKKVRADIRTAPESVTVDIASLRAFVEGSNVVSELDEKIARIMRAKLTKVKVRDSDLQQIAYVGFKTIGDIEQALAIRKDVVHRFAELWIDNQYTDVARGISVFYLCYVVLAERGSLEDITNYLRSNSIGLSSEYEENAEKLLAAYRKAVSK